MTLSTKDLGTGFPVVFLHAFPLDRTMWDQNAATLREAGFRTVAVDLPGFGESKGRMNSIHSTAVDVSLTLQRLRISRAVVCGLSMGGYVAFELYSAARDLFAALILCDTTSESDTCEKRDARLAAVSEIRASGTDVFLDGLARTMISEHTRQHSPSVASDIRRRFGEADADSVCAALVAMSKRGSATAKLASIDAPALLVFGEDDPMLGDGRIMASLIPGSRLKIIESAGHFSNLEAPRSFDSEMLEFLKGLELE